MSTDAVNNYRHIRMDQVVFPHFHIQPFPTQAPIPAPFVPPQIQYEKSPLGSIHLVPFPGFERSRLSPAWTLDHSASARAGLCIISLMEGRKKA